MLSLNGIKAVEVKEDELGIPATALYHVRVPPRHNAVFEVNIHAGMQGTQVITSNKHVLEKHPNMYQHEISIITEKDSKKFPLIAIMNLNQVKTLYLAKGQVVGFARPESPDVTYIAMTNELNIEETVDIIPRNWNPKRKWNLKSHPLQQPQGAFSKCSDGSQNLWISQEPNKERTSYTERKLIKSTSGTIIQCEYHEELPDLPLEGAPQEIKNIRNTICHKKELLATSQ